MILERIVIRNELGLHARPAAEFVKAASRFKCTVQLAKDDEEWVNGKSVLGILTLAVESGDSLLLKIESKGDAQEEQRALGILTAILQGT
jgi:phosphocarrier protein